MHRCKHKGCKKIYTHKSSLCRHKKIDHHKFAYQTRWQSSLKPKCPQPGCNYSSWKKDDVSRHCKLKHIIVRKKWKCGQCNSKFNTKNALNQHQKSHIKKECESCGQLFKVTYLSRHTKICGKTEHQQRGILSSINVKIANKVKSALKQNYPKIPPNLKQVRTTLIASLKADKNKNSSAVLHHMQTTTSNRKLISNFCNKYGINTYKQIYN